MIGKIILWLRCLLYRGDVWSCGRIWELIRPCPFCGSRIDAAIWQTVTSTPKTYALMCDNCGFSTKNRVLLIRAIQDWNKGKAGDHDCITQAVLDANVEWGKDDDQP